MTRKNEPGIWNRSFVTLFAANALSHLCIYVMNTLSPVYADALGAPAVVAGAIAGLFALSALVFKLVSAPAIDTFNRKHVLIGAFGVLFLSFLGYSLSRSIPMLAASRLLTGVGMAFTTTGLITMASDALPAGRMQTGIGYFALGTALCQAIAPALGLKLVDAIGYTATFLALAAVMLAAVAVVVSLPLTFRREKAFRISLRNALAKEAVVPAALLFLLCLSYAALNSFLVLYAGTKGIGSDAGLFFTVYAVTLLFTRPLIGRMADRFGTARVLIPSMCCFAAAFLLIGAASSLPLLCAAAFIAAFGFGGCQPALIAVCMKRVPMERRGAASSTGYAATDLSNLLGPVLAGSLVDAVGYGSMWRAFILPILIALAITIAFRRKLA